jgi:hypothetical protein
MGTQHRNALGYGKQVDSEVAEWFPDGLETCWRKTMRSLEGVDECQPRCHRTRIAHEKKSPARKSEPVAAIFLACRQLTDNE